MIQLNRNHLKMIALVTMAVDHLGLMVFPKILLFRIIGRLAFPIFAYMISEGCLHTRNIGKYFLRLFSLGAVCQIVLFFALQSLCIGILLTFSLSVLLVWLIRSAQNAEEENQKFRFLFLFIGIIAVFAVSVYLTWPPEILSKKYGLCLDYGITGMLIPVTLAFLPKKRQKLILLTLSLILLSFQYQTYQFYSLLSVPLLMLYNGEKGKRNLNYFFYFAYPIHMVLIYGISLLVNG